MALTNCVQPGDIVTNGVTSYRVLYVQPRRFSSGSIDGAVVMPLGGGYARWIDTTWPVRIMPARASVNTVNRPAPCHDRSHAGDL